MADSLSRLSNTTEALVLALVVRAVKGAERGWRQGGVERAGGWQDEAGRRAGGGRGIESFSYCFTNINSSINMNYATADFFRPTHTVPQYVLLHNSFYSIISS